MIRAKRLRPLAVVGDRPVELDGYGTIEPLTKWLPQFKEPANYFGIFIPKSVPPEVIATVPPKALGPPCCDGIPGDVGDEPTPAGGAKPGFGMAVSHSHRRTKRRWNPNIQRVRALVGGAPKRMHVCTGCIKSGKVVKAGH